MMSYSVFTFCFALQFPFSESNFAVKYIIVSVIMVIA